MPPRKTPTSSLSGTRTTTSHPSICIVTSAVAAIELLVNRVWYRSQAKIQRMRSGGTSPTPSAMRTSSIASLPPEIFETIIAHLVYDMRSLRSCALTCYSWYIAAIPHLHYTLCTNKNLWESKFEWPIPLQNMYRLGLLPLVRTVSIRMDDAGGAFSSAQLNNHTLRQFSALTNVRRLILYHLDIPSFMPKIWRYFGHFSSTVQGLCLIAPKGSSQQIIYFIGLFEHLQDFELLDDAVDFQGEPAHNLTLTPIFIPPLRGRLKLSHFRRVDVLKDMIDLFGGIRFRTLDIFDVDGVPLLLDACATTLTTLRLSPSDSRGGQLSLKVVYTQ